jgi:hypothetical protein
MERWVWLEFQVRANNRAGWASKCYYVPEVVIDHIPAFKDQLLEQPAPVNAWEEHTVRDNIAVVRSLETVTAAIRFLVNGILAPLDTASATCGQTLDSLVELYKFSTDLSIKRLEVAVLDHINALNFEALPHQKFLGFARSYYSVNGVESQHTSMGRLIKKKLSSLLPYLQKSMTIEEMSSEGGILGKQLVTVLLEDRLKGQQMAALLNDRFRDHAASGSGARVKMEHQERPSWQRAAKSQR